MSYNPVDIDIQEDWWIEKARVNLLAFRQFMRPDNFIYGWFIIDLCYHLQQFYVDLVNGERPVLLLQAPPQHGKSWTIVDFIAWISGKNNKLRSIFASFSDTLGVRCNLAQQRFMDTPKYARIFPDTKLGIGNDKIIRRTDHLEFRDAEGNPTDGQFRNTTINGRINGESLDLGIIDDAVKNREQANSLVISQKTWEWFTDDFLSRFSNLAGLLVIMTRWTTHDLIARIIESGMENVKVINYQAIATEDEKYRKAGEALFPELKPVDFLLKRKKVLADHSWESLYQGNPTLVGGNMIKDSWWKWYQILPPMKFKFITADTAQKKEDRHDYAVFQCWGYAKDGSGIYLIDKVRAKLEAPELRKEAEAFYKTHDTKRRELTDALLRGMYIEDKVSGTGLIQELRKKKRKVNEIPRHKDKVLRCQDASPYIKAGLVHISTGVPGINNLTKEGREFPDGDHDDDIDTCFTAIEITFINKTVTGNLAAAFGDDE